MTKVSAAGQLPMSNALHFGHGSDVGGGSKMSTATLKRKTPSELRGELLQRKNPVELVDESPSVSDFTRKADGVVSQPRKSELLRAPRFTQMDKHYPVTKSSRLLSRKVYSKGAFLSKRVDNFETSSFRLDLSAKHVQNSCSEDAAACNDAYDLSDQTNNSTERCTSGTFRSVRELSLGGEKLNDLKPVDMSEALKGLVSCEAHTVSAPDDECTNTTINIVPKSFCSELHVPDHKIPLDLTLKSSMRLLCSSSVHWFHRLTSCATLNVMGLFSQLGSSEPASSTTQVTNPGTFYSWVHPQSSLPRAVISALASVPGGQVDFLSKRQWAWEDSFRNLYYMLRKKFCKIFYVCTMQFVVMFTATHGTEKFNCNAYISQSTRTLRSLLKEHDVSFSMPLCYSKVEEVTTEDLVELSVIEKNNLGQTRAVESMMGVDNTPQSLLMFSGNKNVHALYDCLLNYRSIFTSLTGEDVPLLYSPIPFENAAITAPEVRCKQVRKIDSKPSQLKGSSTDSNPNNSSVTDSICYSVEIRDAYLPPWIISGICNTVRSNGVGFQVSFTTDPTSIGLNVGLDSVACDKTAQPRKTDGESDHNLGIANTNLSLQKHSAFLNGLKYGDGSYTAFLSPAE